jgi:hypothetical protein
MKKAKVTKIPAAKRSVNHSKKSVATAYNPAKKLNFTSNTGR